MAMLKVDNLSVHYGVIQAVKDVSIEVNEGEVVTLIGANGAGKTSNSSYNFRFGSSKCGKN